MRRAKKFFFLLTEIYSEMIMSHFKINKILNFIDHLQVHQHLIYYDLNFLKLILPYNEIKVSAQTLSDFSPAKPTADGYVETGSK